MNKLILMDNNLNKTYDKVQINIIFLKIFQQKNKIQIDLKNKSLCFENLQKNNH